MLQEVRLGKAILIALVLYFVFPLFLQAEYTCPDPVPSDKTVISYIYDAPELSIAINPVQPNVVVLAANYESNSSSFRHVQLSTDYGETWEDITGDMMPDEIVIGTWWMDPSVAIDLNNRLYVCYMDELYNQYINYSDDYLDLDPGEEASWTTVHFASYTDKEHIWVDNGINSPYKDNLYAAWTGTGYVIEFTRQTNTENLGDNIDILYTPDPNTSVFAVNIKTAPNGEVYLVWSVRENVIGPSGWIVAVEKSIWMARSLDGGETFESPKIIIDDLWGISYDYLGTGNKKSSYPCLATNPVSGKLFVVFSNYGEPGGSGTGDADIYMISSSNGGDTWSSPKRVNPDDDEHHWYSWISCDPVTRWLSCVYYGWNDTPTTNLADVYVAISFDDGANWTECQVNDNNHRLDPHKPIHCDYIGIDSYNKRIIPAWNKDYFYYGQGYNATAYVSPFTINTENCCVGMRGDANNDGDVNIGDVVFIINYYQHGGPDPFCWEEADVNGDDAVDMIDANYLINYIFRGGPPPVDCP